MLPEVGMQAAIENIEEIRELLSKNTKMVFVTAGMGGGTGTGAAPVIAQVAKDLGILTVGIVTVPFNFEGRKRRQQAEEGLDKMRQNVDTLLIINNERLREFGKNMSLTDAFSHADNILTVAAKGIAEVISVTGVINVDFNDVNTVLRNSGQAIMGSAIAEGDDRALVAVKSALMSPLLNDNDINGARYVLLNITYGSKEVMMDEITEITDYIQDAAGATADVIWGHGFDASLGEKLSLTLIATGFSSTPITGFEKAPERTIVSLEEDTKKEITAHLVSPFEQATAVEPTIQEQLTQEPFLKTEQTVENVIPTGTFIPVVEEKKSFDLFEPTNDTTQKPAVEQVNSLEEIVNETPELKKIEDPISFVSLDEIETEPVFNSPVEETFAEVKPEFTWDVIDTNIQNDKVEEVKETIRPFNLFDSPVTPEPTKVDVVRHMLDDDSNEKLNLDQTKKSLTPEEQQRKAQERVSKIQEYTAKLKKAEGITEFENEPAFVRRNISLNQSTVSTEESYSRFGLSSDSDGRTGLKNNNFLHDNVD
jgi:cell division protein FtsZ